MKHLTEGNIYKTFFRFAIPLVLAGVLSQAYNTIDTVIAGKLIGENALAAIGSVSAFIQFISSVFWGFGNGYSIYLARLFGERDYAKMIRATRALVLFAFVFIGLVSLLIIVFCNSVLTLLKVDESIRQDAAIYLRIYMAGLFFIMMHFYCVYVTNAMGSSTFTLYMALLSAVLNVAGNIICVKFFNMGIAGLAVSTVFSAFAVALCYFFNVRGLFKKLKINKESTSPDIREIRRSLGYSIPTTFQQTIMYVSSLIVSPFVNAISVAASASYTVVLRIYNLNASIYQNSAKTLTNYTAQCYGEKNTKNVRKAILVTFIQSIELMAIPMALCIFMPGTVAKLFYQDEMAAESFTYTVNFMKYFLPFLFFNIINNLFHSLNRGMKRMGLLVTSTAVGTVAMMVFCTLLIHFYGMNGFFAGWVISWIVESIFALLTYLFSTRKIIDDLNKKAAV